MKNVIILLVIYSIVTVNSHAEMIINGDVVITNNLSVKSITLGEESRTNWPSGRSGLWEPGAGAQSLQVVNTINTNNASGNYSLAEGYSTMAEGLASHAEGYSTMAEGITSHAEGYSTIAEGFASHAEGYFTIAEGITSHAEGYSTIAEGFASHAEGYFTHAGGASSHAAGSNAHATNHFTFVWSDSTVIASTAERQFTVHALNGIRLLGGPISGDGSGLTNLNIIPYLPPTLWQSNETGVFYDGDVVIDEKNNGSKLSVGVENPEARLHVAGHVIAADPVNPEHLTTKKYVDDQLVNVGDNLGSHMADESINANNHLIQNLADAVDQQDAVNKRYLDGYIQNMLQNIPPGGDLSMGEFIAHP